MVDVMEMTGYHAISFQPNSGAQGEYAGLLTICRYQAAKGESHRNICLISTSAHGTNPASAVMAGLQVVVIATDSCGNINLDELENQARLHQERLSNCMITYPTTHGIFDEGIQPACEIIHLYGGEVYLDGANMNAWIGISTPFLLGADVAHFNLHKTFSIPHGGGGPAMGPIGVKKELAPFLPNHRLDEVRGTFDDQMEDITAIASAPFSSGSLLAIVWCYLRMMGGRGLKRATEIAILHANYIATRLQEDYPLLYRGRNGRVAHECIIDLRSIKEKSSISEEDIAKRLIDYGFHPPTISWPIPGTMMIEATESESKRSIDRLCDAFHLIREEIRAIERGLIQSEESPLRHALHTMEDIANDLWLRKYSRKEAAFPTEMTRRDKYWPTVNRINHTYGERHFGCSCPPLSQLPE